MGVKVGHRAPGFSPFSVGSEAGETALLMVLFGGIAAMADWSILPTPCILTQTPWWGAQPVQEPFSMCSRPVESCTRLVAVALLMTAAFSTGMQHAHPGGLSPHDHHDAVPLAMLQPSDDCDEPAWFAAQVHMHIFLLGFQFTLPAQDQEHEDSTDSGEHMLVVRLIGDDVTDSAARLPVVSVAAPPAAEFEAVPLVAATPETEAANRQASFPLCDTARHERSGVLRT